MKTLYRVYDGWSGEVFSCINIARKRAEELKDIQEVVVIEQITWYKTSCESIVITRYENGIKEMER